MNPLKRAAIAGAIVLAAVTGCGSGSGDNSAQNTPSSPQAAPFAAAVALSDFSATCREVACWLPTQFAAKLVKGETVSLRDEWPMDGTTVQVVCETTGQAYNDQTGQSTTAWYGIVVPAAKLEPSAVSRASKVPNGGENDRLGYVGAAWIKGGAGKQAPAC